MNIYWCFSYVDLKGRQKLHYCKLKGNIAVVNIRSPKVGKQLCCWVQNIKKVLANNIHILKHTFKLHI